MYRKEIKAQKYSKVIVQFINKMTSFSVYFGLHSFYTCDGAAHYSVSSWCLSCCCCFYIHLTNSRFYHLLSVLFFFFFCCVQEIVVVSRCSRVSNNNNNCIQSTLYFPFSFLQARHKTANSP